MKAVVITKPGDVDVLGEIFIKKLRSGRFGTRALARIPRIAGGAGSLIKFRLGIKRTFRSGGSRRSFLVARCANGRFFAHGSVAFADGRHLAGNIVRPCVPTG